MKPEDLMAKIGHLFVERYAELVIKIDNTADQRSEEAQLKILGRASLEGCRVSAFHAQGQKAAAGLTKLEAEVAKASAQATIAAAAATVAAVANENHVEAPEEMEMDDDTGRTPERIDALYHEIDRRLAALAARREAKGWGGRHGAVAAGAVEGDPAGGGGGAPDAPA
ncbi:hypothetical protein [Caulobacter rhizosphaerae]|jgi:hypothetical protein|uniref:hypothetical protein n=1 Tax=Caulobacter rhizosphaerae TaxID=2010972 RepID=UPI0013D4FD43|nr:hypothetical protein [Caulobacter rhizosphaerae]GGL27972.1 hypothetical protein GCM10010983_26770 [Caulobacter rhizosphaerae]